MTIELALDADTRTLGAPRVDVGIIDVDIHPVPPPGALDAYLPKRWRDHTEQFGRRQRNGLDSIVENPPVFGGMRGDAWPANGNPPGSDLPLLQEQLLDRYNIQLGVMECLDGAAGAIQNPGLAEARSRAINDWQLENLVYPEPRLRAAMVVQQEHPHLAAREIDRIGDDPGVVSVLFGAQSLEPLGNQKYWPIYEAAVRHGLPIQAHVSQGGGHPNTGTGWTSYYAEYHVGLAQTFQTQVLSLITGGAFDEFPDLKFLLVEGGVLHLPALLERFDHHWENLRAEVPELSRKPSEYIRDHIFVTTQPIEEPHKSEFLLEIIEELGTDNVLFASDYPHWDFDAPDTSSLPHLPPDVQDKILRGNGKRLFGLEDPA